jgi:crossover junction endodeoxyribonuclease RuvC
MPSRPPLLPGTRILGIDPGLHVTGYAVIEVGTAGPVLCEAGVVRSTGEALPERLSAIHQGIVGLVEQYQPQVMVVEQLYSHYAHPRTAILMGHARGAILLAAGQHGIDTIHYAATRIKKIITGHGRASKDQVQRTIQKEMGLAAPPDPPDVADALAAALCHYYVQCPKAIVASGME